MTNLIARHVLERDDAAAPVRFERVAHPPHDVALTLEADDRIAERDDEGIVPDERASREDGVAEPERLALPRVEVVHRRAFEGERGEQLLLALLAQHLHELFVDVEVVFNRGLPRTGDEEDPPQPGGGQLFEDVCTTGLRPTGSISFGCDFVAGSRRVPSPATGTTAMSTLVPVGARSARSVGA